jgi:hypothetical protein
MPMDQAQAVAKRLSQSVDMSLALAYQEKAASGREWKEMSPYFLLSYSVCGFIAERCRIGQKAIASCDQIYAAYLRWSAERGLPPVERRTFFSEVFRLGGRKFYLVDQNRFAVEGMALNDFVGVPVYDGNRFVALVEMPRLCAR